MKLFQILCLVGVFLTLSQPKAQTSTDAEQEVRKVCEKDLSDHCKGAGQNFREQVQCLQEHGTTLSHDCRASLEKTRKSITNYEQACAEEHTKLCPTVPPGQGNLVRCLEEQKTKVSRKCREALEAIKK